MATSRWAVWAGWVISVLLALLFLVSAVMKLAGISAVQEGMAHLGLPLSMLTPLSMLEMACAVVYVIPATAVLGAVLLTGYLGGAICTHWRVGDPFLPQIVLGLLVWLGIYLREERLRPLLPLRRP
jgi:uncharacterized membrane protein YphA (DoxX/SURF4 family)